ncbi:MAG TPA: hypothetical protein VL860_09765, partial [Planctomycetota bacterium]|nr:hypothetical protein [Planctomycetota bacterium]
DAKYKSIDGMTVTPGRPTLDPAVKEDGDVRIHWPYPTMIHLTDAPADTKKPTAAKPATTAPAPAAAPAPSGGMNPLGGRKSGGGY